MPIARSKMRHEVERDLTQLVHEARRCWPVIGDEDRLTDWDLAHRRIDAALDVWEKAPTAPTAAPSPS